MSEAISSTIATASRHGHSDRIGWSTSPPFGNSRFSAGKAARRIKMRYKSHR